MRSHSRRGRPAHPAGLRLPAAQRGRRPQQGGAARADRAATWPANLLVSLSGSFQTTPSFWIDPKTGTQYNVAAQTPQYALASLPDLGTTPLTPAQRRHRIAAAREPRELPPQRGAGGGQPLRRDAGHRHLRLGRRHRPRLRPAQINELVADTTPRAAARLAGHACAARSKTMTRFLQRPAARPGRRGRAGLSADRGQLSVLARSRSSSSRRCRRRWPASSGCCSSRTPR